MCHIGKPWCRATKIEQTTDRATHETHTPSVVGGGDRIHPGNARKSGRHGAQQQAQCVGQRILLDVQGAVLALVVRQ